MPKGEIIGIRLSLISRVEKMLWIEMQDDDPNEGHIDRDGVVLGWQR